MTIGINEQFGAVDALTQFARLAMLDRVWTTYLERADPPISKDDLAMLEKLVTEMSKILKRMPDVAGYLNQVVHNRRAELEAEYQQVMNREDVTEPVRGRLGAAVERHGGIGTAVASATSFLRENADREIQILQAKISIIREGGFSSGDLTPQFLCNLGLALVGGGVFAPFPMNVIGIATGAAVIVGVEMSGNEC